MGFTLQQPGSADKSEENINVRAAFIHVIGDFLQSVGVFVAALTIYFKVSIDSVLYLTGISHIMQLLNLLNFVFFI